MSGALDTSHLLSAINGDDEVNLPPDAMAYSKEMEAKNSKSQVATESQRSHNNVATESQQGRNTFCRNPASYELMLLKGPAKRVMSFFVDVCEKDFLWCGEQFGVETELLKNLTGKSPAHISNIIRSLRDKGFLGLHHSSNGGARVVSINPSVLDRNKVATKSQ